MGAMMGTGVGLTIGFIFGGVQILRFVVLMMSHAKADATGTEVARALEEQCTRSLNICCLVQLHSVSSYLLALCVPLPYSKVEASY
jgi:uncharacterized membrane protein